MAVCTIKIDAEDLKEKVDDLVRQAIINYNIEDIIGLIYPNIIMPNGGDCCLDRAIECKGGTCSMCVFHSDNFPKRKDVNNG